MDVHNAAAGEDFVELVAGQLVVAGAAADHHGLDVQVIERGGQAVKLHPVVGDHLVRLLVLAAAALRVAAAHVARWHHRLHARVPQHGLGGQANLAEQPLRAAAGEIEHRFRLGRGGLRIADDGDVVLVLNVQQRAGGFRGQAAGQLFVHEVDHLLFDAGLAHGGRGALHLRLGHGFEHVHRQPLGLVAHANHAAAQQLDGLRLGGVQKRHGQLAAGVEAFFVHLAQQVAHVHGHVAKVDLHRAGRKALVAQGAVLGHVLKLLPVVAGDAPARLLLVQKGFHQQRGGQNLVAWRIQQVRARNVRVAHRLALAAAQAVLDRFGNGANVGLLHDDRLVAHQPKAGRVGVGQVGKHQRLARGFGGHQPVFLANELAPVEAPVRVDALFVIGKGREFFIR